jgi:phosphoribosylamine--glycine ligase/phosphoribosylformylglycinamidine cyclo-ligase
LILPSSNITVGDVLIGLASSGVHSNGFSLVRKIVSRAGLTFASPCPWKSDVSLGRILLEPTQIYISQVLPLAQAGLIKGMSHITGGGFIENIPRVLPNGLGCYVDAATWDLPPVFRWLIKAGNVEPLEMARTFNNGIGLVLIVAASNFIEVSEALTTSGSSAVYRIGEVTSNPGVEMRNVLTWVA